MSDLIIDFQINKKSFSATDNKGSGVTLRNLTLDLFLITSDYFTLHKTFIIFVLNVLL